MKKLIVLIIIIFTITCYAASMDNNKDPLDLQGLNLGDSYKEVVNVLGENFDEEFVHDDGGYVGENYYIWHYENGIDISIGVESKEILSIAINTDKVTTSIGTKVGDKAKPQVDKYKKIYDEYVSIHTDKVIFGWFKVSDEILLILDFDKDDLTRYNRELTDETEIEAIEVVYLNHFD